MVLCLDDAVGGRALAWDVEVDEFTACGTQLVLVFLEPGEAIFRHTFVLHFEVVGGLRGEVGCCGCGWN